MNSARDLSAFLKDPVLPAKSYRAKTVFTDCLQLAVHAFAQAQDAPYFGVLQIPMKA